MNARRNPLLLTSVILLLATFSLGFFSTMDLGYTGAPGEVACAPCHHNPAPDLSGSFAVQGIPQYAIPGQSYPIIVSVHTDDDAGETAGFQMTILQNNGTSQGQFAESNPYVQKVQTGNRRYVEHDQQPSFYSDDFDQDIAFPFSWTPDAVTEVTTVVGYLSAVLGDGNWMATGGGERGDSVYTVSQNITIVPVLSASIVVLEQPLCAESNEGSLQVQTSGGLAPLTYSWSTGGTTNQINGLSAGNYTVTVTDAIGQQQAVAHTLSAPAPLSVVSTIANPSCGGSTDGSISLMPTGGTPPYSYLLDGNPTSNPATGLGTGTYEWMAVDANGCSFAETVDLIAPEPLLVELIDLVPASTDMSGAIVIEISGGTTPYDFFWQGPDDYTNTIQNPFGLAAGIYMLTLTDGNGCMTTYTVEVPISSGVRDLSRGYAFTVSPNPGAEYLNLTLPAMQDKWQMQCLTSTGEIVYSDVITSSPAGQVSLTQEWEPGLYFITLRGVTSGIQMTQKWLRVN